MFSKLFLSVGPLLGAFSLPSGGVLPSDVLVFGAMMQRSPVPEASRPKEVEERPYKEFQGDRVFRVMSFNIRVDDAPEHPWLERRDQVISVIRFHEPAIVGLQEPNLQQIGDILAKCPEYECVMGPSFVSGGNAIHNPILVKKSMFQVKDSGSFFLSEAPDESVFGWDAKFPRGVTFAKLETKQGDEFFFFNTHFDYHGKKARFESAYLLREKVTEIAGAMPFVVAGDFNLFPKLNGEATYKILVGDEAKGRPLIDAQKVSYFPHHGPTGSWSGFKEAGQSGVKPDFIFVDGTVDVVLHAILTDSFNGEFPSDHLPVVADISIKN